MKDSIVNFHAPDGSSVGTMGGYTVGTHSNDPGIAIKAEREGASTFELMAYNRADVERATVWGAASGSSAFVSLVIGANSVFEARSSEVIAHRPLTMTEQSSTPPTPSDGLEARVYVKGDKLIVQFNNGGTVRYKYLDLSGTGTSWTHMTTAP